MNSCSVCSSDQSRLVVCIGGYSVSQCHQCSHTFVSAGLATGELDKAYGPEYYDAGGAADAVGYQDYLANSEARTRGFTDRLRQIEARVSKRGCLLDYGCAVGLMVKVAAEAGWEAIGYERSPWAAQYGRDTFGLNIVLTGDPLAQDFESRFDVVTMWDVLEHLEHPRLVLETVSRWLKPGGLLTLNTVNRSSVGARLAGNHWRHLLPPHHLQYFSRSSLRHLLKDCGFDVLHQQSQGVMLTADRRKRHLRGLGGRIEAIGTHWRAKRLATAFNLLDEIEVFAVRR